ncbi:MAG: hypothetical protein ACR2N6_05605 [Miltoncostaeaceae bacterium]
MEAYLARVDHEHLEAPDTGRLAEVRWRPCDRGLAVVLMNASGGPNTAADVEASARIPQVLWRGDRRDPSGARGHRRRAGRRAPGGTRLAGDPGEPSEGEHQHAGAGDQNGWDKAL